MKLLLTEKIKDDLFSTFKELAKKDNKTHPRYFFLFSNVLKIGVNPRPLAPGDVYGVYAFPVGIYREDILFLRDWIDMIDFIRSIDKESFGLRQYIIFITPAENARIWYLSDGFESPAFLDGLKKVAGEKFKSIYDSLREVESEYVWTEFEKLVDELGLYKKYSGSYGLKMAKLLKTDFGIDGVVDNEGHVLGEVEEYQAVFIPPPNVKVIDVFENAIKKEHDVASEVVSILNEIYEGNESELKSLLESIEKRLPAILKRKLSTEERKNFEILKQYYNNLDETTIYNLIFFILPDLEYQLRTMMYSETIYMKEPAIKETLIKDFIDNLNRNIDSPITKLLMKYIARKLKPSLVKSYAFRQLVEKHAKGGKYSVDEILSVIEKLTSVR